MSTTAPADGQIRRLAGDVGATRRVIRVRNACLQRLCVEARVPAPRPRQLTRIPHHATLTEAWSWWLEQPAVASVPHDVTWSRDVVVPRPSATRRLSVAFLRVAILAAGILALFATPAW